jgi:hypothetical protein
MGTEVADICVLLRPRLLQILRTSLLITETSYIHPTYVTLLPDLERSLFKIAISFCTHYVYLED